jgi:predicted nucleic acid-binding protein
MQRGCRGDALLLVPDLCLLECASVLLKQVQRTLLTPEESRALLADLLQLPLRPTASAELITADEQLAKAARSLGCLA